MSWVPAATACALRPGRTAALHIRLSAHRRRQTHTETKPKREKESERVLGEAGGYIGSPPVWAANGIGEADGGTATLYASGAGVAMSYCQDKNTTETNRDRERERHALRLSTRRLSGFIGISPAPDDYPVPSVLLHNHHLPSP
jgi:hypothetical protein